MRSLAARSLVPELLDTLPADDPGAMRSRGDIRRINAISFAAHILAGRMRRHAVAPPRRILDIGCGDGRIMLALARRLAPTWPGVAVTLLDRQNIVAPRTLAGFTALGWSAATRGEDVLRPEAFASGPFDIVVANLFLHHFGDAALAPLLANVAASAGLFVAAEPRRRPLTLVAAQALGAIGANRVTRHDAPASVRAGFRAGELTALWPRSRQVLEERTVGPFTHVFAARGTAAGPAGRAPEDAA
ncbi:methyltransferase domain-containing protein [Acuticoccus sediminis]|uniref:methyltransferase domain-containing protein n=1 Tax=Acuticoccus sediminis TaxID=2184697 RepID=UPI001CFCC075|nr:methyltransferase domain-containing protein [Acuticoccus sediminis]